MLTEHEDQTITLAFSLYDLNGLGTIMKEDVQRMLTSLGYKLSKEDGQDLYTLNQLHQGTFTLDVVKDFFRRKYVLFPFDSPYL